MADVPLTSKEIVRLLVKHGQEFVCHKERAGVSPLECGAPDRRIASSGAALRKQLDSGDFRASVSLDRYTKLGNEKCMWWVSLEARFGRRSPGGARRVNLSYEVVGPTPAQLLAFHEADKLILASGAKGLPSKRAIKTREDIL